MAKILVVDDDAGILEALSLILEDAGYLVETTIKGEDTLGKVKSFKPTLILLDVLMSGTDGREICRKLKREDTFKNIPVIMISAHPSAKRGALECGAEGFLAKPFEVVDLFKAIQKYI